MHAGYGYHQHLTLYFLDIEDDYGYQYQNPFNTRGVNRLGGVWWVPIQPYSWWWQYLGSMTLSWHDYEVSAGG